ncbi:MAG TPA: ATP-binding protein [Geothermobacteraceae bacterium]|nr:ATP-binding protein [Geothermobacteraceae bacterium]
MFRLNLHKKVLYAFWALSLVPLALLALNSSHSIDAVENLLLNSATNALDEQASEALELRAEMVGRRVADFLTSIEQDVRALALLPVEAKAYQRFAREYRREVWYRTRENGKVIEKRESIPIFKEVAYIDRDGMERLRLVDGEPVTQLRDVSLPANTTFKSEDYFAAVRALPPGEIYVSHLTGWHVSKEEQLNGAASPEEAFDGKRYEGVVRFAMPIRDAAGGFAGMVMLSLDHRHLMEFSQHINPTQEQYVVFPSYRSGNYAFIFDDEGWIITHPKYWDIRGLDRDGQLVPPYTRESSPEDVTHGIIPYNLFKAGFIHPNYPVVANRVLRGEQGVVDVTNVGGSSKIMAYAPIPYRSGVYAKTGVFGGITIGAEVANFHRPAVAASTLIRRQFTRFLTQTWLLITATVLLVFFSAYHLSRGITKPLMDLIAGTKEMARGNLATRVVVSSHDEVGELTRSFNTMAAELRERRERLMRTLEALRRSRREILRERNFKETVFENIETGILTLNHNGKVTSMNGPARQILGLPDQEQDRSWRDLLSGWPEILAALDQGMQVVDLKRWSQYVNLQRDGNALTFRLALLPLTFGENAGRMLAIEDLTDRVNLRRQMERMERMASLGRLSAGIAHEVRNPLTGISLLLDDLHDRMISSPGDQQLIRRSLEEMERLEELIGELLNFASLPKTNLEKGDVAAVLKDTLFLVQKQLEKNRVSIDLNVAPGLPAIPLDANRLKQAIINLLTNAIDAMPEGGTLTIMIVEEQGGVAMTIADTGEGISSDRLPLIFEPFYTSKGKGTGLGLSITHNIISDHGGRVQVTSREGMGTSFTIWLPAQTPYPDGH